MKDNTSREAHPTTGDLHKGDDPQVRQGLGAEIAGGLYEAKAHRISYALWRTTIKRRNYFEIEEKSLPYDVRGMLPHSTQLPG